MENTVENTTNTGNEANTMLCPVRLFYFFIRKNFPEANATNEEIDEINKAFSEYLINKCTQEQLNNFMPKSEADVIFNTEHPFRMNGFHPAFVYHYSEFVQQQIAQFENEK
jgi:flagellar biosynthesis protein FliP